MIGTRLRSEHAMLVRLGALSRPEAREANARAERVTFLGTAAAQGDGVLTPAAAPAASTEPA